jgi:hypothetical protein
MNALTACQNLVNENGDTEFWAVFCPIGHGQIYSSMYFFHGGNQSQRPAKNIILYLM